MNGSTELTDPATGARRPFRVRLPATDTTLDLLQDPGDPVLDRVACGQEDLRGVGENKWIASPGA